MFVPHLQKIWSGPWRAAQRFAGDNRGLAAVEFAFIVPLMLVLFFGTLEVSNGVAADRKVTLTARSLSDLISQATSVTSADIDESFTASRGVMSPYNATTIQSVVSEIKIDAAGVAKIAWSRANANGSARTVGTTVTLPSALAVPNTYLIWSEVGYRYIPTVGYVVAKAGIPLSDQFYTRPRQSTCVLYGTSTCP